MKNGENILFWLFELEFRECNVWSLWVSNIVNIDYLSIFDYFIVEMVVNILIIDLNLICYIVNIDYDFFLLFLG